MLSKLKLPIAMLMGLTLLFGFYSCDKDDDTIINEDQSIVDVLSEDARFSTLTSALERTGLDDVLSDRDRDFTLFAPTNDAFTALGVDLGTISDSDLEGILLYHVFGDDVVSSQIQEGKTYLSTAAAIGPDDTQLTLLISRTGSTLMLNNEATVTEADLTTENGVIHVINAVLTPLDVVGHAAANDDFSQLVDALGNASGDLVNTLSSTTSTFTVFAPTNAAFDAISSTVAGLTPDQLASVLTYHVIAGANLTASMLTNGQTAATVQGENITINISGNNVSITDAQGNVANVLLANVQGTNGVIHVIDKVIMPSSL